MCTSLSVVDPNSGNHATLGRVFLFWVFGNWLNFGVVLLEMLSHSPVSFPYQPPNPSSCRGYASSRPTLTGRPHVGLSSTLLEVYEGVGYGGGRRHMLRCVGFGPWGTGM